MTSSKISDRTVYNLRLAGAVPGFAGAVRHVLAILAKDPQAIQGGLFFRLSGSLRDRLIRIGLSEGLAPEFAGVMQQLGVAKLTGAGRNTVWHLLEVTFAADLLQEPWITKAFEAHLERGELFSAIRVLEDEVADLKSKLEASVKPEIAPEALPIAIVVDEYARLREFFEWAFANHLVPAKGEGLHFSNELERIFEERFTIALKEAIDRLVAERFLRINPNYPRLVWKGCNFPEQAPKTMLRVVGG